MKTIKTEYTDKVNSKNIILIVSISAFVIFLWIIISWLTGTWPRSLKCKDTQSFLDGKCYDNVIGCTVQNWSWTRNREWNDYGICKISSCNTWYELIENSCLSEMRSRTLTITWPFIVKSNKLWEYPSIKVNNPIQWWTIRITIDFVKND